METLPGNRRSTKINWKSPPGTYKRLIAPEQPGTSHLDDLPAVSARSAASDVPDRDRLFCDLVKYPVPAYP